MLARQVYPTPGPTCSNLEGDAAATGGLHEPVIGHGSGTGPLDRDVDVPRILVEVLLVDVPVDVHLRLGLERGESHRTVREQERIEPTFGQDFVEVLEVYRDHVVRVMVADDESQLTLETWHDLVDVSLP